ncbi:endogenous retrovirus group K member 19 Gag polyprotein-like [Rhinolophus ferrumequinum]|uniref:endogenous retrovirus group K member 19 Gag polyprotein-like n=1 Tax=Rhinolophus ferrumequinum TaxID=59479 RepID=UPI00140FEBC9|nr:endogenous retrovirus group K member 19 Gag polyprotein-like [Rhinolophus ferrumequinum]
MGNANSQCRSYICLLKHLLKAGGARVPDQKLEELLKVTETSCPWFPKLGMLDFKTWGKVGAELLELYHKGVYLPVTIWDTWKLIRSVLESLQIDEEDEGEEERQESEEKEEGSLEAPTEIPRSLYPPLEECHPSSGPLLDLPHELDSPLLPEKSTNPFLSAECAPPPPSGGSHMSLSMIEKGIHQAPTEGDLEAFPFPVIIHERVTPGEDPNNPSIVREFLHEPFSFKLLKELKQSVTQYGPASPYTIGLVWGAADGNRLIPTDWNALAKTCLSASRFLQFKTWWNDGAETQARHNQAHNIAIVKNQLLGSSYWEDNQDQLEMKEQVVDQLQRICLMAWEKIEREGEASMSFQKVLQGPQEPYSEFVARLQDALNKKVTNSQAAKIILQIMAYDNANDDCKKAIGTMKGKTDTMGYIYLCQGIGTEQLKAAMLAQAMTRFKIGQNKFPGTCYNCGKFGHKKKECKKKIETVPVCLMLLLLQDLNYLYCALNDKKEITELLNADQFFIRMGPLFRKTRGEASPRP